MVKELQKPWAMKTRVAPAERNLSSEIPPHKQWTTATLVGWLFREDLFCPNGLPKMNVPSATMPSTGGVYQSKDEYLDTVEKLWVAMTSCDGHPRSAERRGGGVK